MYCGHCGSEVPAASPFCRDCGAPIDNNRDLLLGTPEGEMYPLLAAANLLRIRRQWDDATAKCIEVLRKYPNNASAHSLLGDIYRDQGMLRDAIEWYKLALELDPTSRADRAKLDHLADELYDGKPAEAGTTAPAASQPLRRTLRDWLELTQLNRPVGIVMVVVVLALFVGLLGAIVYNRTGPPVDAKRGMGLNLPVDGNRRLPVAVATSHARKSNGPTASYAQRERQLAERLAAAGAETFSMEWLAIDPRDETLQVSLRLKAPAAQAPAEVRTAVASAALTALRAAAQADEELVTLQARVLLAPAADDTPPELAFVGQVAAARLHGLADIELTPQEAIGVFTDSWWSGDLRQ